MEDSLKSEILGVGMVITAHSANDKGFCDTP
jgi:hypothetical protein